MKSYERRKAEICDSVRWAVHRGELRPDRVTVDGHTFWLMHDDREAWRMEARAFYCATFDDSPRACASCMANRQTCLERGA